MAKIRVRPETGRLYLDFSYRGVRCREQTALDDSPANRKTLQSLAQRIKREITQGTFDYRAQFPDSPRAARFDQGMAGASATPPPASGNNATVRFAEAAETWFQENTPLWAPSHIETIRGILDDRLLPAFGEQPIGSITRAELLEFRSNTSKSNRRKGRDELSPSRVNHIMDALRMVLADASERFEFMSPFRNIKPLRVPKMDIEPFSLDEVNRLIGTVRADYRAYLTTRFFTGLRTGEINALEWHHIDLDNDLILVRQSIVKGVVRQTKTHGSIRDVPMVPLVRQALLEQRKSHGESSQWVFPSPQGGTMNLVNFTNRVWKPLLRHLGYRDRRPYQTRHTAATLMLAAGENPEWVARVLGHSSTEMLFRVYSRFVPNVTRNDGRAFTGLVTGAPIQVTSDLPASLAALSRNELESLVRNLKAATFPQETPHDR